MLRAITAEWDVPCVLVEGNAELTPTRLVGHHNPARSSLPRRRRGRARRPGQAGPPPRDRRDEIVARTLEPPPETLGVTHWRITLHFTPTSGSWLNLVEVFFSIITRKAIRRGSYRSVEDLTTARVPQLMGT